MSLGSHKLGVTCFDQVLGAGPSEDEDVAILCRKSNVGVGALAMDIPILEHTDEDGSVQVGRVNHADVASGVVEILQLLRKRRQEGREIVVVQQSLVPCRVGHLCWREPLPEFLA